MIPNEYRSYEDAVRGEVLDRLDSILAGLDAIRRDRAANIGAPPPSPCSHTAEQESTLAARLIMPRTNGTFTGSPDPTELVTLASQLGILPEPDRIECPVPWCAGSLYAHGGDGRTADDFEHSPAVPDWLAPRPLLRGEFYQVGDTPPFYRLDTTAVRDTPLLTVSEVRALADDFERHAVTLRERAAQLEALGGIQ